MFRILTALLLAFLALPAQGVAQNGTVMPMPRAAFYDANGNPCSGCKLYAFETGTNTDLTVYQEVTLTTPHAQPVVLDSAGRATVFLQNRTYRFRLDTSADVVIWTVDGVSSVPAASGNIDVVATAGETIAINEVVYLSDGGGGLTSGRWYRGDADNTYSSAAAPMIGIATAGIASGATGTVRLAGRVTGMSGLTAGALYYISATAGSVTAIQPTNSRFVGSADSTTSLIIQAEGRAGQPRISDSDNSHSIVLQTTSNLTTDRFFTLVTGDAARTLTVGADSSINQDVSTAGSPSFSYSGITQGRLTLTTGLAVTTSDVTAATSIYFTPFHGNRIALYTGTQWTTFVFTERTLSIAGYTANSNYDVYLYDNSGTLTLETAIWTNDTTRATALVAQDGVWVKTGATTRRYVGTIRTTGTVGQTEDSYAKRFVFNADNRVARSLRVLEASATWQWNTASWHQANASTANQLAFVVGLAEDSISATATATASVNPGVESVMVGIGLDVTNAVATGATVGTIFSNAADPGGATATYSGATSVGYHFLSWIEFGFATTTFFSGGTSFYSGISATWRN